MDQFGPNYKDNNMSKELEQFIEGFTKAAAEKLGSVEAGADFVRGFLTETGIEKEAFFGSMAEGAGKALGAAGVGLALGALANRMGGSFDAGQRAQLHVKFQAALNQVKSTNRIVKAADQTKVNSYAETIFRFGPHVAGDANVLASLLANFIQGESIDPMSIKTIVDLEGRYKENVSPLNVK